MVTNNRRMIHSDGVCNCDEVRDEKVSYRSVTVKTKDLIDMRSVIHQKIEQVLSQSNLWSKIMPEKIFHDLVNFIANSPEGIGTKS